MSDWKSLLRADTLDWLLEEDNPSVRYFTLKDLLDQKEECSEVQDAKQKIMRYGVVPAILNKQNMPEYKETYNRFYRDKYKGIVWQLIVLAEHGAQP